MQPAFAVPRFALTEAALRLIQQARTTFADAMPSPTWRRISLEPFGTSTPSEWRQPAAFVRLLTICESYVDALSMELFSLNVDLSVAALSRMVEDIEVTSTGNWQARNAVFGLHHGVALSSCARWNDLQTAAQVRNCLAHGLGKLTPRQRRNSKLPVEVAILGVTVGSGRMHLGRDSVPRLAIICHQFVMDVDTRLPQSHLGF